MSREIIELYERGTAALNSRAISDELAAELLAPGFRVDNAATAVTDRTYLGAEGVREWIRPACKPQGLARDARPRILLIGATAFA